MRGLVGVLKTTGGIQETNKDRGIFVITFMVQFDNLSYSEVKGQPGYNQLCTTQYPFLWMNQHTFDQISTNIITTNQKEWERQRKKICLHTGKTCKLYAVTTAWYWDTKLHGETSASRCSLHSFFMQMVFVIPFQTDEFHIDKPSANSVLAVHTVWSRSKFGNATVKAFYTHVSDSSRY